MHAELSDDHIRARASDPVTSHMAAADAKAMARKHAESILMCLVNHGPLGKDGIARLTGIDGVAVARRLPELQRDGHATPTGNHVPSASGRLEREWATVNSQKDPQQ